MLPELYDRVVLAHPRRVLVVIAVLVAVSGWQAQYFRLDASADALVLENDAALRYYREIRARYGADDFLVLAYRPAAPLFEPATLAHLARLRDELRALPRVETVTSILDVPLLRSPPVSLAELRETARTLEDPDTDPALAREELLTSPLYRNLLISPDGDTTALRIDLARTAEYQDLIERRGALREKRRAAGLSAAERRELVQVSRRIVAINAATQDDLRDDVRSIRAVLDRHRDRAELHLGGVPMIVADSIGYIRHDLVVFGAAVFLFIVLILAVAFRRARWVVLPLITCAATAVSMLGLLGLLDWPVTVVSANFLALLLIITLSLVIHLLVRYRELHARLPAAGQFQLVRETVHSKAAPAFYTALTTMAAFGSLVISDVRPVIDFGWMMTIGAAVAFLLTFTLFPAAALLLRPRPPLAQRDLVRRMTALAARLVDRNRVATWMVFALLAVFGLAGTRLLTVENRFIDYFKAQTEIHRGMQLIDRELGGTTPLDIIVDAPAAFTARGAGGAGDAADAEDPFLDDPFLRESADADAAPGGGLTATSYWFNRAMLERAGEIHDSIEGIDATGKVLSIATTLRTLAQLTDAGTLDDFFLSILHRRLPEDIRAQLFDPYLSSDGNQLRFAVRVFESDPGLDRDRLLDEIRARLIEVHGLEPGQIRLSGMLVLYNNMLHSLFRSQILTLGAVFLAILVMFTVLFRNLRLALLALLPNLLAAALVLGLMGWLRIPLDLMTITIAAISIGIAVDDTIHYLHRYRAEFAADRDYRGAVARTHASVGRALFYTTLTISLGFSILALSSFVPTIYFGLFTGVAMIAALAANLTLLPLLITRFRPLGVAGHPPSTANEKESPS